MSAITTEKLTVNGLALLTGKSRRAVKERLRGLEAIAEDRQAGRVVRWYDPREALTRIYEARTEQTGLAEQRARLAAAQAWRIEAENRLRSGELIERREALRRWNFEARAARAKFMQIPAAVAALVEPDDRQRVGELAESLVRQALDELADFDAREAKTSD